jgi:hypothetical protein
MGGSVVEREDDCHRLICVFNDGAYGSEVRKLRADGMDETGSSFRRTDLAAIARGSACAA